MANLSFQLDTLEEMDPFIKKPPLSDCPVGLSMGQFLHC